MILIIYCTLKHLHLYIVSWNIYSAISSCSEKSNIEFGVSFKVLKARYWKLKLFETKYSQLVFWMLFTDQMVFFDVLREKYQNWHLVKLRSLWFFWVFLGSHISSWCCCPNCKVCFVSNFYNMFILCV